jgi:hypothetical protein
MEDLCLRRGVICWVIDDVFSGTPDKLEGFGSKALRSRLVLNLDCDLRLLKKLIDLGALRVGSSSCGGLTSLGSERKNLRDADAGGGLDFKDLVPGESVNMDLDL